MKRFRSLKSETSLQTLAYRTSCEMYMPYDGAKGTSPSRKGKFTIGNEKSSLLSYILVISVPLDNVISRSRKGQW